MKLSNIKSLNEYARAERISMVINLMKGEGIIYKNGKQVDLDKIGSDIWRLIEALNTAEQQIEKLQKIINELIDGNMYALEDVCEFDDYIEEYPEDENYQHKYKLDEAKARVHHCMRGGKDEKYLSKAINQYNMLLDKGAQQ